MFILIISVIESIPLERVDTRDLDTGQKNLFFLAEVVFLAVSAQGITSSHEHPNYKCAGCLRGQHGLNSTELT